MFLCWGKNMHWESLPDLSHTFWGVQDTEHCSVHIPRRSISLKHVSIAQISLLGEMPSYCVHFFTFRKSFKFPNDMGRHLLSGSHFWIICLIPWGRKLMRANPTRDSSCISLFSIKFVGGYVGLWKTPMPFSSLSCYARNLQNRICNTTLYTNSGHVFNSPKGSYVLPLLFYYENQ